MNSSLSAHLRAALCCRAPTDVLFQLAHIEGSQSRLDNITVEHWASFVRAVQQCIRTASPPLTSSSSSPFMLTCDVAVMCRETFYACLLESACVCGGRTFCVLNPDDPPRRLDALREQVRATVQITDAETQKLLEAARTDDRKPSSDGATPLTWAAVVNELVVSCEDTRVAYYIYTSGSTGTPKCVVGTRANLSAYGRHFARDEAGLACTPTQSHFLTLSTPFFDPSLGDTMCVLLSERGWQRMVPRACLVNGDLPRLLQLQPFPTHIISTPALWRTIPSSVATSRPALPARTKLFLGGERLTQSLIDTWAGAAELHNIYGVTEATVYQSVKRVPPGTLTENITCGSGAGLNILDIRRPPTCDGTTAEHPEMDDDDSVGEVVMSGPQVCLGYGADVTMATGQSCTSFRPIAGSADREYWTGDLARWVTGSDGRREVLLVGRRDAQVKVNGQRTSLEEVEAVMQRVLGSAVVECCCGASKDEDQRVILAGGCVLPVERADGRPTSSRDDDNKRLDDCAAAVQCGLQALLRQHLPSHAVPSAWLLLLSSSPERLPRTATGKLDRPGVATKARASSLARVSRADGEGDDVGLSALPASLRPHMAVVTRVWERELGVPVHPHTNFFLAGGDSLGALKLCRAVFMAVDGRDGLIDACGGLPAAFRPHVLMQHPRLADYVVALSAMLSKEADAYGQGEQTPCAGPVTRTPDGIAAAASSSADESTVRGAEALHAAVSLGCTALAEQLVASDVSAVDGLYSRTRRCVTPLHIAAAQGHVGCVEVLLGYGARVMAVSPDGVTPLHVAAGSSLAVLERLLNAPGAAAQCRDGRQQSLLHVAARHGRVETVRYLLTVHGLDVAVRDKWQRSPAHWAALHGHVAVLRAMWEVCQERSRHPADVNRKRHRAGTGKSRFVRLAQRKTTLAYETLSELAARVAPQDAELQRLCAELSPFVEQ